MARQQAGRKANANVLESAAVSIGRALGRIARRVDTWKKDRAEITQDINDVITRAQAMLDDVEKTPAPDAIGSLAEIAHVTAERPGGKRSSRPPRRSSAAKNRPAARSTAARKKAPGNTR